MRFAKPTYSSPWEWAATHLIGSVIFVYGAIPIVGYSWLLVVAFDSPPLQGWRVFALLGMAIGLWYLTLVAFGAATKMWRR